MSLFSHTYSRLDILSYPILLCPRGRKADCVAIIIIIFVYSFCIFLILWAVANAAYNRTYQPYTHTYTIVCIQPCIIVLFVCYDSFIANKLSLFFLCSLLFLYVFLV